MPQHAFNYLKSAELRADLRADARKRRRRLVYVVANLALLSGLLLAYVVARLAAAV